MSGKRLVIVDYGMGNLRSVQKAFESQGHAAEVSSSPAQVASASHLVLPGVGAFQDAIANLRASGLAEPVLEHLRARGEERVACWRGGVRWVVHG